MSEKAQPTVSLLQKVPRYLSPEVYPLLLFNAPTLVAWAILAFVSLFFWIFLPVSDLVTAFHPDETMEKLQATVTKVEGSGLYEGRRRQRHSDPILRFSFRYELRGQSYEGASFDRVSDESLIGRRWPAAGQPITVLYDPEDPSIARIQGMRHRPLRPWAAWMNLVFVALALLLMAIGTCQGLDRLRRLRMHYLGRSVLQEKHMMGVGRQIRWRLTFAYKTHDGQNLLHHHTTVNPDPLLDETRERLLYDPADSTKACLVDAIHDSLELDEGDTVRSTNLASALCRCALPFLVLLGNLVMILNQG